MKKPSDINEYISGFPKETQDVLTGVRDRIKKIIPEAEEVISYGIPTFKMNGRYVVYFAGYKDHISLYPAPRGHDAFKKALSVYKGGKGTVQFPLDKPMPFELIERIVKFLVNQNAVKSKSK